MTCMPADGCTAGRTRQRAQQQQLVTARLAAVAAAVRQQRLVVTVCSRCLWRRCMSHPGRQSVSGGSVELLEASLLLPQPPRIPFDAIHGFLCCRGPIQDLYRSVFLFWRRQVQATPIAAFTHN